MKYTRFIYMLCAVALAAVILLPASSEAGTKKIWMDRFTMGATDPADHPGWWQDPSKMANDSVAGPSPIWWGAAVVKLPVGKRILAASYYHYSHVGAATRMMLFRVKHGQKRELLFDGTTSLNSLVPVETALTMEPGKDLVVRRGYRYFLVGSAQVNTNIAGAKIRYR